ncbi:MAG: hypothetical protein Kow0020_08840 [Wenzhouxiangellaceae bacterium]
MTLDLDTWTEVSRLFDELADMDPTERRQRLSTLDPDPQVRDWLMRLLKAHDSNDSELLDQTLDALAGQLFGTVQVPSPEALTAGGRLLGRWRIVRPVAEGAMAVVCLGERADGAYEQQVAIKLLKPGRVAGTDRERLAEELRLLARLEHPNVARLIDGGLSDEGWPYLVMEYVDGLHIDRWCREQALSLEQRIELMIQVCDAVQYAHSRLIVHADLKPSNVLVNPDGEAKLVDFGIARWFAPDEADPPQSASLLLRCSPAYAAPEQLRGESPTTACDVFGLGALLYELISGHRIRDGRSVTTLLLHRSTPGTIRPPSQQIETPVPARRIRGELDAICARALAEDPADRYGSAAELRADLRALLRGYPVEAASGGPLYRFRRWLQRNRVVAGAVAMVFISLAAGLYVSIQQTRLARHNAERAELVQDFLMQIFATADPVANQHNPVTVNQLLRQRQQSLALDRSVAPDALAELQWTLADLQAGLGNHAEALELYQALLPGVGDRDRDRVRRARLLHAIGTQYLRLGRLDEAEEAVRGALALVSLDASAHPQAVRAQRTLAEIRSEQRDRPGAIRLLERIVALEEQVLEQPGGTELLGGVLAELGELRGLQGDREQGLELLERARSLLDQAGRQALPDLVQADAREAGIFRASGDFEQAALASYRSALAAREVYGPLHSQSLRSDIALAVDLAYLRCHETALRFYEDLIPRYRQVFGEDNLMYANALLNLASTRRKLGDYARALDEIDQTLSVYARHGSESTDLHAYALSIKAQLLFALDRIDEALPINAQALEMMRARLGPEHPQALRVQVSQGHLAHLIGDDAQARALLEDAYGQFKARFGSESGFTRDAAARLAEVYRALGEQAAYEALRTKYQLTEPDPSASSSPVAGAPGCRLPEGIDLSRLQS